MSQQTIFLAALDIADGLERQAFVKHACQGDRPLERQVETLLAAHERPGDFLNVPAFEQVYTSALIPAAGVSLPFLEPSAKPGSLGRLGHYEIQKIIGQGGFGIVLLAFDEMLHREVALKVMAPHLAFTSPARKRFLREARSSAAIRHKNVVSIHGVAEEPIPYLTMEYVPGGSLQQRIDREGPLEPPEVIEIGRQIASGLAAAHTLGIVHRDINPSNVLLEPGAPPTIKITDFGLARAADDASLTRSGYVAGTPLYMAPEQATAGRVDFRADLFSLGSVLYAMCTGRPPFRAPTMLAVLKRVSEDAPRPIGEIIPEVPDGLCAIIERLHAKDPGARFSSAREVFDVLGSYALDAKGRAQVQAVAGAPAAPATASQTDSSPVGPRRWTKRILVVGGVFFLALLLGGLAQWLVPLFRPGSDTPDTSATLEAVLQARTEAAARAWPSFLARAQAPGVTPEQVWKEVATYCEAYPGTPQSFQAGELLLKLPPLVNSIGMKLVALPPGRFLIGSPAAERTWAGAVDEGPRHEVVLTRPFLMGVDPVTVGQFAAFVQATNYVTEPEKGGWASRRWPDDSWKADAETNWRNPGFEQADDHPVVCLSTNDCLAICRWLGERETKKYGLPTEAQWEYACRAGSATRFYFGDGDQELPQHAWYRINSDMKTHPVGQKKANAWGLHDMLGHVWQRTADWYAADYYATSPREDPPGPADGKHQVWRGGCWSSPVFDCRSSRRLGAYVPWGCSANVGFRVVVLP
jgi:formylglycine-generating enzyme required for sulfatase activity